MGVNSYEELREHIGHKIVCVCYGKEGEAPHNVAVECEDCNEVLFDFDHPDTEDMEDMKFYPITSVTGEDIISSFEGHDDQQKVAELVEKMTDDDMKQLAGYLAVDYTAQLYWDSLRIIFQDRFMEELKKR